MKSHGVSEPSLSKSLLLSILFHGLLVAGILFLAKPKPLPKVVSMEASLVGSGDLAGIQGQIAKAYAKNQAQAQTQSQSQTSSTPAKPLPSHDYSQEIARREAEYQAQMKAYADALDQDIASEMHAYQQALDEADREREREVAELERRERSNDDIAQENAKELQKAKEQLAKERTQQAKQEASASSSNDRPAQTAQSSQGQSQTGTHTGSSSGSSNAGSAGASKASAMSAIKERIYHNWSPEAGLKGKSLTATIRVDSTGQLSDIRFGAGDKSLAPSLENAIRASAPFPEVVGVMSQFTINFYAD